MYIVLAVRITGHEVELPFAIRRIKKKQVLSYHVFHFFQKVKSKTPFEECPYKIYLM